MDDEFGRTVAGQTIIAAHGYLLAAETLRASDQWAVDARPIWRPTLYLVGHGLELLLKFPHFASGVPPKDVGKAYGHNLAKLWNDPKAEKVRTACLVSAEFVWGRARMSGQWPADDFEAKPGDVLQTAVSALSEIHGGKGGYVLRYPSSPEVSGPRPLFMIETFNEAIGLILKTPDEFY